MPTFTPRTVYKGVVPTAAPAAPFPYTVPGATAGLLNSVVFTNGSQSIAAVTLYIIPSGQSVVDSTMAHIWSSTPIPPGEADDGGVAHYPVLNPGDSLAFQSSAAGVNVIVSVGEKGLG